MKVTVFTPTYNRGYIIANAYESLRRQTCKDFEWVVVDDGSTDNTGELFDAWTKQEKEFPIRYQKVPNGGKIRAANLGARLARGELFLNLDSDDYLTEDAIETVILWENTIKDQREHFAGVAGLRCHFDDTPIGESFLGEYLDASPAERSKYGITGDKVEVFYTELLRKYPFPEFSGEKFLAEGVNWIVICHEEQKMLRWFNKAIYKCEYLTDGYSASIFKLALRNPKGILYNCLKTVELTQLSYFEKLRVWHKYYLVAKGNHYTNKKIKSDLKLSDFDYTFLMIGHYMSRMSKRKRRE